MIAPSVAAPLASSVSAPLAPSVVAAIAPPPGERSLVVDAMGGRLSIRIAHPPGQGSRADRAIVRVAARVGRWADRLTRFSDVSDVARLNAHPGSARTPVGPTLGAVLDWAERCGEHVDGHIDVTLLDARIAAEAADPGRIRDLAPHRWWLERSARGGVVHRVGSFRFDLDGVAKGWIADRALALLRDWPAAVVDADGDIAMRTATGVAWEVAIDDPRPGATDELAVLRFHHRAPCGLVAVATSGTSVHRWEGGVDGVPRHHLIDPRTRLPADTDVIQATVIAASAREAEVLAKAAVIAGSETGLERLERSAAWGAVVLLASGAVVALPRTLEWIA